MGHREPCQGHESMKLKSYLLFGLAILLVILLSPSTSAAPNPTTDSCSETSATIATGSQFVRIRWNGGPDTTSPRCSDSGGGGVGDANFIGLDVPAGSPYVIECREFSTGAVPPQAPTSVVISAYSDASNIGGGGTPIWTSTQAGCSTSTNTTLITQYATSNGLVGGTPRDGIIRLFVNMINTNTGQTYNCNSDNAGTQTAPTGGSCNTPNIDQFGGVIRADPGFSVPNLTSNAGSFQTYIGGDTIQNKITTNSSSYDTGTARSKTFAESDSGPFNQVGSAFNRAIGVNTQSQLVQGAPGTWPTGSLLLQWTETGGSAITGYSGLSYWIFTSQNVATATVINANTIQWSSTDTLNRALTPTLTVAVAVNGVTSTIGNRADTFTVTHGWKDARGVNVPNNQNGRMWYQKAGDYRVTSDFPSQSGTFGAQGIFAASMTATTSATVTTGLNYHNMGEEFGTAVTDANLFNWGNSTGILDVTNLRQFSGILNEKTNPGTNVSSFTIAVDQEFIQAQGLHGANGAFVSGQSVQCQRFRPDASLETTQAMGTTDASGNTAVQGPFGVTAPQGSWTWTCTESDNGNTATYTITFFFQSPFTANTIITTTYTLRLNGTCTEFLNVTSAVEQFTGFDVNYTVPDGPLVLEIQAWGINNTGNFAQLDLLDTTQMTQVGPNTTPGFVYEGCLSTLPNYSDNWTSNPIHVHVSGNVTGRPFTMSVQLLQSEKALTNLTGNFTGNFNITGTVNGMITTAFDNYIPIIIFGGIAIMFLAFTAWLPAIAAFIALGDQLLQIQFGTGLIGLPGDVMLIVICLVANVLATNGIIPMPFGRQKE